MVFASNSTLSYYMRGNLCSVRMQRLAFKIAAVLVAVIGLVPGIRLFYITNFTNSLARNESEQPWFSVEYVKFGFIAAIALCVSYMLLRTGLKGAQEHHRHSEP